jgi:P-loop Nucleotide Kinase3
MDTPLLVYLIGPPGAGKSTLMVELTRGCDRLPRWQPVAHELLVGSDSAIVGAELGRRRERSGGTDALSAGIMRTAEAWVKTLPYPLLLGEGDRLAYRRFFGGTARAGYRVTIVYLSCPPEVCDERCADRNADWSASWRLGRATKAERLAEYAFVSHRLIRLSTGTHQPADLAATLRHEVPELGQLAEVGAR